MRWLKMLVLEIYIVSRMMVEESVYSWTRGFYKEHWMVVPFETKRRKRVRPLRFLDDEETLIALFQ